MPVSSHELLAVPVKVGLTSMSMKACPWRVTPALLGMAALHLAPFLVSLGVTPHTWTVTPG